MSNLEEAYTTFPGELASEPAFEHDVELELMKMIHDRETIYNNVHVAENLYQNKPMVCQEDIDQVLKEFDMDSYVSKCSLFKSQLSKVLNALALCDADYNNAKDKVNTLNDMLQCLTRKFFGENVIHNETRRLLEEAKSDLTKHEDNLVKLKKKLYILHKFSPHYSQNDPRKLCSICIVRDVDTCNVPCGHTLCSECSNKMLSSRSCFFCRTDVEHSIKLFFT